MKMICDHKKRALSIIVIFAMLFSLLAPAQTAFAAAGDGEENGGFAYITIENQTEEGVFEYLLEPTKVEFDDSLKLNKADLPYVWSVANKGYSGAGLGTVSYSMVSGFSVTPQDKSSIKDGGYGMGPKLWKFVIDGSYSSGTNPPVSSGGVARMIYSYDKGKDVQEIAQVNKDELIKNLAMMSEADKEANAELYQRGLALGTDKNASQGDVDSVAAELGNIVSPPVAAESVSVTPDKAELTKGERLTLTATVLPENSSDRVVWESDNEKVAKVSAGGTVTAIAEGTVKIIARANDKTQGYAVVTVKEIKTSDIKLSETEISIEEGASRDLTAALTPADSTDDVVWTSENEEIAAVSDGRVIGKSEGQTTITANAGEAKAECSVTVTKRSEISEPTVIFRHSDGRITKPNEKNTIKLSGLDFGSFEYAGYEGEVYWKCMTDSGVSSNIHISSGGNFNAYSGAVTAEAVVYTKNPDLGGKKLTSFTLEVEDMNLTELILYKEGEPIDAEEPIFVNGRTPITVAVKGKTADGRLVDVPNMNFDYSCENSENNKNIYFALNYDDIYTAEAGATGDGTDVFTVILKSDSDLTASFTASGNKVRVTGIEVNVPKKFEIESWNLHGGEWNGLKRSNGSFSVKTLPYNASDKSLKWESLDPEVAYYKDTHDSGIQPLKAGTARFAVSSVDNPAVKKEIEIEFVYKTPLEKATIDKTQYELKAGDRVLLDITATPKDATEQTFDWSYSENGIVQVSDVRYREDTSTMASPIILEHRLTAIKEGTVTVTGTPKDNTGGAEPVVFTVTVKKNGDTKPFDYEKLVTDNILHGNKYIKEGLKGNYIYGAEWYIFTALRSGEKLAPTDLKAYYDSVVEKLQSGAERLQPTDYFRIAVTLEAMGKDPADVEGVNIIEKLYNFKDLTSQTSNQIAFALMALDSKDFEIPSGAKWQREDLTEALLTFQNASGSDAGGFGLGDGNSASVDMTAMILQALAPYNNDGHKEVQEAVSKALVYLQNKQDADGGYFADGDDNGCTAAQVLTALSALRIDPLDEANGFVKVKDIVSKLNDFKRDGGFATYGSQGADAMGTYQITYALEAYERFVKGESSLYDLTDVKDEDMTIGGEDTDSEDGNKEEEIGGDSGRGDSGKGDENADTGNDGGDGNKENGKPEKTGDEQNLLLWIAMLAAAGFGAGELRRRQNMR